MANILNPYISFHGKAREALEFYKTVFDGRIEMATFGESGMAADHPGMEDRIMHGMIEAGNGMTFMVCDDMDEGDVQTSNISISLSGDGEIELRGYWERLSAGGNITEPLVTAPWGDTFGMLTDKFGINWMVNIAGPGRLAEED